MVKQPGDRHFLLISAGERADGLARPTAFDRQPLHPMAGGGVLSARLHQTRRAHSLQAGKREVLGDAERKGEAFHLAIFTDHADPLAPTLCGGSGAGVGFDAELAVANLIKPENRAQQFGTAGTDQAGDAEHFAAAQLQRGIARAV